MTQQSARAHEPQTVSILGLGAMGSALAAPLLDRGHVVTVWNRSPGRGEELVERGARRAGTVADAVHRSGLIVTCLLRYASVRETLDPVAERLRGRTLLDLTTTTPAEARALGAWAEEHGIEYLNGAILATPPMIGAPGAQLFVSGSAEVLARTRTVLEAWAEIVYDGADPGAASLIDLAMLAAMYQMFAGLFHGAAMAATAGMRATDFAARAVPFVTAMVPHFAGDAEIVDGGDYSVPGQQSLHFSDLSDIIRASDEAGANSSTIRAVQALIAEQVDLGFGDDGMARIYESLRRPHAGRDDAAEAVA
ncbi:MULTISPECIES: NAD(P)-dependent oxidoreductase [Tsukamurella]|uniref:NAD(P)-dependent oxidoreductase n=2 Tax=Tsukamurella TaxID=2060 RepID=A0A5C5S093_9ACTN|nr:MULTISPECIES: NAD(P)-binding domain-containing protein [Tsukamurella]NMD54595.1 NAD(P)-dependent oxidoreductase [Tsukamurella columbiensis]TWS28514.1 NAD(P)-dependent oxidoreductase [Tsukamurella conjunctivitidis]